MPVIIDLMRHAPLLGLAFLLAACGGDEGADTPDTANEAGEKNGTAAALVLAGDPGEAVTVAQVKKAKKGDEVVVVGRVQNIVDGYAAFRLADPALEYCSQHNKEDRCPTPWDYCCVAPDKVSANLIFVEARDEAGKPVKVEKLPGLRPVDLVAIRGTVERDDQDNVTIVAEGWHRRERPTFEHEVRWP